MNGQALFTKSKALHSLDHSKKLKKMTSASTGEKLTEMTDFGFSIELELKMFF